MIYCRCCSANKDNNGRIVSYNFQTSRGILTYSASEVKDYIRLWQMGCYNLKMDKRGRLIHRREPDLGNNMTLPDLIKAYATRCKLTNKPTNSDDVYDIYMTYAVRSKIRYTLWEKYLIYAFIRICANWDIHTDYSCSGQDVYYRGTNATSGTVIIREFAAYLGPTTRSHFFPQICGDMKVINQSSIECMCDLFANVQFSYLDLSGFNTDKVTDMQRMFYWCRVRELDLSHFNTSKVQKMQSMFAHSSIEKLNLSSFDTRNVESMREMFNHCHLLQGLDIHHFNLSKVYSMIGMFGYCNFVYTWNISGLDTSHVKFMGSLFDNSTFDTAQAENLDTSNVMNMANMFQESIVHDAPMSGAVLNLRKYDVRKCESFHAMFADCQNLSSVKMPIIDSQSPKVTLSYMFDKCQALRYLELDFNTQSVVDLEQLCNMCLSLTELRIRNLDLNKLTPDLRIVFSCQRLKILRLGCTHTGTIERISLAISPKTWNVEILDLSKSDKVCVEYIKQCILTAGIPLSRMQIIEP